MQRNLSRRAFTGLAAGAAAGAVLPAWAQDPPLSPVSGGRTILPGVLQVGDMILSTTGPDTSSWSEAAVSALIRAESGNGPVSHAMVFIGRNPSGGGDSIIDATKIGVAPNSLAANLQDCNLAVAFRYPGIGPDAQKSIADFSWAQVGKKYDYLGAVASSRFRYAGVAHLLVDLGLTHNKFYCSKLVLDAYSNAGKALTLANPQWNTPNDLVQLTWFGELEYVGHLKYPMTNRAGRSEAAAKKPSGK